VTIVHALGGSGGKTPPPETERVRAMADRTDHPADLSVTRALAELRRARTWDSHLALARLVVNDGVATIFDRLPEVVPSGQPDAQRMTDVLHQYAGDGKRLRALLILLGYQCAGGRDLATVVPAAAAYELIHAAFLVHDDIMDESDERRGNPAAQVVFEKARRRARLPRPKQFGISMAINAGDMGPALAYHVVAGSCLPSERVVAALQELNAIIMRTVYGQCLDVSQTVDMIDDEARILEIHEYKTAVYTVSGPLRFGAILGGIAEQPNGAEKLEAITTFGRGVGIGFQIRDDFLGTFGIRKDVGKSVTSDASEKKNTLQFFYALQKAGSGDLAALKAVLGRRDISDEELSSLQGALRRSGAVRRAQARARQLVADGKQAIPGFGADRRLRTVLGEMADWAIVRKS
jgi:geranylgeranyl diphosphate synthase, type I